MSTPPSALAPAPAFTVDPWFLPRSGATARVALGTMNFGKRTPAAESERILARAVEKGVTLFDTANVYNDGESERIVGRALAKVRGRCLIASKVGLARVNGKPEGLSRAAIERGIDATLGRLGLEYVDMYYLHAPDASVDPSQTLDAMQAILAAGKARAWGVSNFASWQILELFHLCDARGMPRPAVAQQIYNVLVRQLDVEYFAFARRHPIHTCVYNPLAGGLLAAVPEAGAAPAKGSRFDGSSFYKSRYWTPRMRELALSLADVAQGEGMSLLELAYAWLARRDGVDSILVGPSALAHLDAALDACDKELSPEARKRIDALHVDYLGTDARYAR